MTIMSAREIVIAAEQGDAQCQRTVALAVETEPKRRSTMEKAIASLVTRRRDDWRCDNFWIEVLDGNGDRWLGYGDSVVTSHGDVTLAQHAQVEAALERALEWWRCHKPNPRGPANVVPLRIDNDRND